MFVDEAPAWRDLPLEDVADAVPDGMTVEPVEDEYCQRCGDEVAAYTLGHEAYDSDIYAYQCGGCGDSGVQQYDEAYADGPVYMRAEVTSEQDFFRAVEVSAGATVAVKERDADYDALSPAPDATADGAIFEKEFDAATVTRPDGLLRDVIDHPAIALPDDVERRLEGHVDDPDFVVELYDPAGRSRVEDPQVAMVQGGRFEDPDI